MAEADKGWLGVLAVCGYQPEVAILLGLSVCTLEVKQLKTIQGPSGHFWVCFRLSGRTASSWGPSLGGVPLRCGTLLFYLSRSSVVFFPCSLFSREKEEKTRWPAGVG